MTKGRINIREPFIDELIDLAKEEDRLVVLDPDVGSATRTWRFRERYPDRFYEMGIAEQNTFGVAAGLAATGRIVVAATFAVFASMRACEMVRTSISYPRLNVKVIGGYAGLSNGKDGATHQSVEDMAIMRSFPNMVVMCPSDETMARKMVRAAVRHNGPVYIRVEYGYPPTIYPDDLEFSIGRAFVVREGADLTIASYGLALARTLEAAQCLAAEGIEAEVVDVPTLKPFDRETLLGSVRKTGALITVEEHSIIGGLASAAGETLLAAHLCPHFRGLGVPDVFTESGTTDKLRDKYGIGLAAILEAARALSGAKKEGK